MALIRPNVGARGVRPPGPAVLNVASPQARSLVAWFPVTYPERLVVRDVVRGQTLALTGTASLVGTPDGGAQYYASAASSYWNNASVLSLAGVWDNPFTVSIWWRSNGAWPSGGNSGIFNCGGYSWLLWDGLGANELHFGVTGNTFGAGATLATENSDGRWHLATGVYRGSGANQVELWIDNRLRAQATGGPVSASTDLYLGSYVGNTAQVPVMDARIYARALSGPDIQEMYTNRFDLYAVPSARVWPNAAAAPVGRYSRLAYMGVA